MPKDTIDYSNTIIYKITCNDTSITDIYVGHTTNFIKRKYQHKVLCNNSSKLKIYDIIRQNGGWNNWSMVEIAKYCCQDVTEARIREQEHYELLKPSLNSLLNNAHFALDTADNTGTPFPLFINEGKSYEEVCNKYKITKEDLEREIEYKKKDTERLKNRNKDKEQTNKIVNIRNEDILQEINRKLDIIITLLQTK